MQSDLVREFAKDKGLTYSDIGSRELFLLWGIVDKWLKKHSEESLNSTKMKLEKIHPINDVEWNDDGTIKVASLLLSSSYFANRECISFNRDGFIGFAGWASSDNLQPIAKAFVEWVREIKGV